MAWYEALVLFAGIAIVVYGADEAIKRLLHLSRFFRLSAFVTGVVIAGTLAVLPEMSIGILSALGGTSTFGLGIILGSNVADLTLVIGVVILLAGNQKLAPVMLKNMKRSFFAVLLPVILLLDGALSRIDGGILVSAFLVYVIWLLYTGRKEQNETQNMRWRQKMIRLGITVFMLIIGITVLFIGSELVSQSANTLSYELGLPIFLIGIVVSIGTCLPEMAFAIRATENKDSELGLGNILGNVLADSMLTLGVIALIQPIQPTNYFSTIATGIFMVSAVVLVYWRSRDHVLSKNDAVVLLASFALFVVMQYLLELFA